MKLLDLRRYAIRHRTRIRFTLSAGECVISERGVVEIPGFRGLADFNVEEGLAAAQHFLLDRGAGSKPQKVSREQLEGFVGESPKAEHGPEE